MVAYTVFLYFDKTTLSVSFLLLFVLLIGLIFHHHPALLHQSINQSISQSILEWPK